MLKLYREYMSKKFKSFWLKDKAFQERRPDPTEIRRPVIQEFDCLTTAITHTIRSPFHYVERVIMDFRYETASESFLNFGVDAALTDPILIKYDGKVLFEMICTACMGKYSYDVRDLEDDSATKFHTVHSRFSFNKFNIDGLRVHDSERLELVIQEDLSGSSNEALTFTFEGWYQ